VKATVGLVATVLLGAAFLVPADQTAEAQAPGSMWETRTQLPESFSEIAVGELNGKIYVIGGYPGTRVYVNTVQVYDPATDDWSYTTPVPQPLHHTMAASSGGKLYVIGGEISPTGLANQGVFINNVYEYDPATATWTEKTPMPTARSGGTASVIDGKIYVAGGRPPGGADFAVYDPATDTWTVLPNMPTQRNHLASGVIGGKMYVAGGRFGGGVGSEMTDIMEIYDPATNTWTRGTPLLEPRAGLNGIAVRGCLYTFGGEGNDPHPLGIFPNVEVYNSVTDAWIPLESIPVPVHGVTGSAYVNGNVHLPGGGISRGGNSGATIHQVFPAALTCE